MDQSVTKVFPFLLVGAISGGVLLLAVVIYFVVKHFRKKHQVKTS